MVDLANDVELRHSSPNLPYAADKAHHAAKLSNSHNVASQAKPMYVNDSPRRH